MNAPDCASECVQGTHTHMKLALLLLCHEIDGVTAGVALRMCATGTQTESSPFVGSKSTEGQSATKGSNERPSSISKFSLFQLSRSYRATISDVVRVMQFIALGDRYGYRRAGAVYCPSVTVRDTIDRTHK